MHTYQARYEDIVQDQEDRITTYEMYMDDVRSSVSIATVELEPGATARLCGSRNRAPSSTAPTGWSRASGGHAISWTRSARHSSVKPRRPAIGESGRAEMGQVVSE